MTTDLQRPPRLPPRWFIRLFWQLHRALIRVTGEERSRLGATWREVDANLYALRRPPAVRERGRGPGTGAVHPRGVM